MNHAALAVALSLAASVLSAPQTLAQNLVANPRLVRELPPPGWIADRRAEWLADHPVYQSTCRTAEVNDELEFLNRTLGRDDLLIAVAASPAPGDPAAERQAEIARQNMGPLHRDVTTIEELSAQLRALPPCSAAASKTAPPEAAAATGLTSSPGAAQTTSPAAAEATLAPSPSVPKTAPPAVVAAEPAPAPSSPSPPQTESPATAAETAPASSSTELPAADAEPASAPSSSAPETVTLRYDDKVLGLRPLSILAFNKAADAIRNGADIRLAIEGCDASADFSKGAPCEKRLKSLKRLLADKGIHDTKQILGDLP